MIRYSLMETTKRKLFEKLRAFYNNRDFVLGVISNVETEESYQKILDFMDTEDVSVEDIIVMSVILGNEEEEKII